MADEPKPESKAAPEQPSATSTSPAPTEVAGDVKPPAPPAAGDHTPPAPDANSKVQAEPLSDGTTPVVLAPGSSHRSVAKGKAGLTTVYRKADIITTLLTFVGAVIAGGIIIGAYAYLTRAKAPAPTAAPKVTSLSTTDLDKLNSFFNGNSAGNSAEVLTISSSSLFKNRVAVNSDLKVVGGVEVSGTTALGDLTVDKVSTLGVTNVRGQLTVAGPTSLQGPTTLGNGLSVTGNTTTTGNGTFGGSVAAGVINAPTLSVTTINLSGHISTSGPSPSISGGTIGGTDTTGNLSITGTTATVTFHSGFTKTPIVMLTPTSACSGSGQFYVQPTGGSGFIINNPAHCTSFNYWVSQ